MVNKPHVYTIHTHMISGGIDMIERQRGNVFQADAHMDNACCLWVSDSTERALTSERVLCIAA